MAVKRRDVDNQKVSFVGVAIRHMLFLSMKVTRQTLREYETISVGYSGAESANPANRKAPVRHMEISTTDFQCGEAAVPGIEDIFRNGAMPSVHSLIAGSRPYTSLIER